MKNSRSNYFSKSSQRDVQHIFSLSWTWNELSKCFPAGWASTGKGVGKGKGLAGESITCAGSKCWGTVLSVQHIFGKRPSQVCVCVRGTFLYKHLHAGLFTSRGHYLWMNTFMNIYVKDFANKALQKHFGHFSRLLEGCTTNGQLDFTI